MSKSVSNLIKKSVESSLSLIPQDKPKIILGVSGGADSMALLYTFYKIEVEVLVVHINYGLRGNDSDLDQELVEGMSTEWGFDCYSVKIDDKMREGNFQSWARSERYRIFKELKEINNLSCIATAHHQSDQIETILQKVFRGSGAEAWEGMSVWDGELFRPLLPFSKSELLMYCEENSIPYKVDKSNLESNYARNFIRNELEKKFDGFFPGWRTNILALSEKGNLTGLAIEHITDSMLVDDGLDLSKYSSLDEKLKSAVLKKFINLKYPQISLSKGRLLELLSIEESQVGTSVQISNSVSLIRDRSYITLQEVEITNNALEFDINEAKEGIEFENFEISLTEKVSNENSLYLDASLIKWPLMIRTWRKGDKFIPFGMAGSQKISDHLVNRKIPSSKKEKALILSDVDSTIYAIIFPLKAENGEIGTISEIIKCNEQTTEYLTINLK